MDTVITTKLIRRRDRLVLELDAEQLEAIGIHEQTPLSITAEGKTIVIRAISEAERQRRFESALQETVEKYDEVLRRLAQ